MGPLQRFELYRALRQKAAADPTHAADVHKLLGGLDRAHRHARQAFEAQATHQIESAALSDGMSQSELDALDQQGVGGILPAGWFQALLKALPQILAFIQAILKMFGL